MILNFVGIHHFDRFMKVWIERFPFCGYLPQAELHQRVLQLLVDQLYPGAEIVAIVARDLQRAFKTIEDREQRLDCVADGVLAVGLLFANRTLTSIFEFRLQAREPIE